MFEEMTSRWSPFPNTDKTLGAYDYFSQTIRLNSVDGAKLKAALEQHDFPARLEVIPLLTHEMQHFVDHTASIWGRDLLVRLFDVYAVRQQGALAEFWRIPEMMRELKTVHYSDYYTEYSDLAFEPWDGKRWWYQFSTGVQLDANGRENEGRPIVFTRFGRNEDEAYICRVPFSVASLLEVRAEAAAIMSAIALFKSAGDDPVRKIDQNNWYNRLNGIFYDATMTLYTVAAHCFANRLKTTEGIETYNKASHVAWLCLNLPRRFFPSLSIPKSFSRWGPRNEALRANADRGYLYLALIENGRDLDTRDMDGWLDEALCRSSLPPLADVLRTVEEERDAADGQIARNPYRKRLEDVLHLGREYARQENHATGKIFLLESGPVPPLLLSDNQFAGLNGLPNTGTFADPGEWYDSAFLLYERLREFIDACIV
jgi:hypothetical protein